MREAAREICGRILRVPRCLAHGVGVARMAGVETLSDHRYIRFEISTSAVIPRPPRPRSTAPSPRWALKRLDQDALVAASIVVAWPVSPMAGDGGADVDAGAA